MNTQIGRQECHCMRYEMMALTRVWVTSKVRGEVTKEYTTFKSSVEDEYD